MAERLMRLSPENSYGEDLPRLRDEIVEWFACLLPEERQAILRDVNVLVCFRCGFDHPKDGGVCDCRQLSQQEWPCEPFLPT